MPAREVMENHSASSAIPARLLADIQRDFALQEYGRALARMEEHWRAAPSDPPRQLHYATILGHCSRFGAARRLLDELVHAATPERRLWALGSAGVASCDFQRFDWTAEYMRQAAAEPQPPAMVFHRWVEALERLNRLPEAAAALFEGRSRFPDHADLSLLAARLARRSGAVEEAERTARAVIGMPDVSPDIRCQAGYELGHALDAQDRCDEAYAAFVAAKQIQRTHAEQFSTLWQARIRQLRSPENSPTAQEFRRWAEHPPAALHRHALLVGCPRSGTTLLERMLGSHPQLACSSESAVWHSDVWTPLLREHAGASSMRGLLAEVTPEQVEAARERYWRNIVQALDGEIGKRLLLDKNPSIFPALPGAARLFPQAHVLVALRDPRDVVWSCFTQPLPINAGTAAFVRLESTAEQVAAELEQWLRLRAVMATPWLEVRYETLVQQPELQLRRVLSFLGLPWSSDVLAFHERRDPIRSPTYAPASQPVHQRAVGRWRRYAELIAPLEPQLRTMIRELE